MASKIDNDEAEVSEINVTPFVDVVLVLLVIFMIATPALIKESLRVDLPKSTSSDGTAPESLGIVITEGGQYLLDGKPLSLDDLAAKVKERLAVNPELQGLIAADAQSRHQELVSVIDRVKQVGLKRFALEIKHDSERP